MKREAAFLSAVCSLLAPGCDSVSGPDRPAGVEVLALPLDAYTRSSINLSIYRKEGLLTVGDHQVVSYFGDEEQVVIVFRDLLTDRMSTAELPSGMESRYLGDGHQGINLGRSRDGLLHLVYGAHATEPHYLQLGVVSFDEGEVDVLSTDVGRLLPSGRTISYPQFYDVGGDLSFVYRDDPEGSIGMMRYEPSSRSWVDWHDPLLRNDGAATSVYINTMAVRENRLAIAYTVRREPAEGSSTVENEDLYVIASSDGGDTWWALGGEELVLPVPAESMTPVLRIERSSNLMNQAGASIDSDGVLWVVFYRDDAEGIPQVFLLSADLDDRTLIGVEQVTERTRDFELEGCGTLRSLPLSRPAVVSGAGGPTIVYREGDGISLSRRREGGTWEERTLYTGDVRNWEPLFDPLRVEAGILSMFVHGANQGECDFPAMTGRDGSAYIVELALD